MLSTPAAIVMPHTPDWMRLAAKWIACCDGGCGHLDRKPGGEHGLTRDVHRLLTCLHHAAEDDIVHHRGFDGRPTGHLAEHVGGEHDGMDVAKVTGALIAPAHRGSHRFDDHDVSHGSTLVCSGWPR